MNTYENLVAIANEVEKLNKMRPGETAKLLLEQNCKGGFCTNDCPVFNYLKKYDVCNQLTSVGYWGIYLNGKTLPNENNLRDFIRDYDGGKYPELYAYNSGAII